jgi:hypothetical protein
MAYMFALLGLCGIVFFTGIHRAAAGTPNAPFKVLRTEGDFEIREYPSLTIVETSMAADGGNGSFMRLFHFIGGRNEGKTKIAMTAPVLIAGPETNRTMAFIMPVTLAANQVPHPADAALTVDHFVGGTFAVMRYSGGQNNARETEALAKLQAWMVAQKLTPIGGPAYGYFDPPWIPTFWRHNEVMLRTTATAP